MQEDLEKGTTLQSFCILDWLGKDLAGKLQSTFLSKVCEGERMCVTERKQVGRDTQFLDSDFWHLMRTEKVGNTQLFFRLHVLMWKVFWMWLRKRGHLLQGEVKGAWILAQSVWILPGCVTWSIGNPYRIFFKYGGGLSTNFAKCVSPLTHFPVTWAGICVS